MEVPTTEEMPNVFDILHVIVRQDSAKKFDNMWTSIPNLYKFTDHIGDTLLHLAVRYNNESIVKYLCSKSNGKKMLHIYNNFKLLPMHYAFRDDNVKITMHLLKLVDDTYMKIVDEETNLVSFI